MTIQYLINFIRQAYTEFCKLKLQNKLSDKTYVSINLDDLNYIDQRIINEIKTKFPHGEQHHIEFCGINVKIIIAGGNNIKRFLLFYTCFLIYLFKVHVGKILDNISITFICYEGKKHLPDDNSNLGPFEVNGGVTISMGTSAKIFVYRYEEIVKVLTHEMIHAFGLDAKTINENDEDFLNKYFNITCKSATINESFTDSLACLINAIMYTHFSLKKDIDDSIFIKRCWKNIQKERKHIIHQAQKVLSFNNYKKHNGVLYREQPICETTHVTSYYVIKAIVYQNLTDFITLLSNTKMCIDIYNYIHIIKKNLPIFVHHIKLVNNPKREQLDSPKPKKHLPSQWNGGGAKTVQENLATPNYYNHKNLKMSSLDILELYNGLK